jgi:orotate phosphoribosyltransferase
VISSVTLADLAAHGSHQKGHFRLSSGLHSSDYLQCALFLANPVRAERAGRALAKAISSAMVEPGLVASPALGGVILGHETARAFKVPFVFTERVDGTMKLRREFGVTADQAVVVVEDVVTTGGSTREVIEVMTAAGGYVVGVGALVNRSGSTNPFDPLPFASLITVDFPTWPRDQCPLCQRDRPLIKPGSRPVK